MSSTGKYWAAGGRRGEVRVWREAGQMLHLSWQAHTDLVLSLAFSPDERLLASGSLDGSVKLWEVESRAPLWSGWHTKATTCLAFAPDGRTLASSGYDGTVRIWDAQSGIPLKTLPHPSPVFALAWGPHGHLLASGDVAGTLRLWQMQETGQALCVQMLAEHSNWVRALAFAPDGSQLASASWDGTVKLWGGERRKAYACARRWWGIPGGCKHWPGVRMEARWPVAALTTRSRCGMSNRAHRG